MIPFKHNFFGAKSSGLSSKSDDFDEGNCEEPRSKSKRIYMG